MANFMLTIPNTKGIKISDTVTLNGESHTLIQDSRECDGCSLRSFCSVDRDDSDIIFCDMIMGSCFNKTSEL